MSTNTREGVASYEVYERLLLERRQFHYFCCAKGSRRSVTYLVNSYELHFMITHLELFLQIRMKPDQYLRTKQLIATNTELIHLA